MIDDLLGRTELKERIEELEAEKQSLEEQLEAESERRSEASRERQEAERRVNELEARVEELEDRVERAEGDDTVDEVEFRDRVDLQGDRLARVLTLLDSVEAGEEGVLTAYVADDPPEMVREAFGDRAPLVERAAPCLAVRDREGVVAATLRLPNPPGAFAEWSESVRLDREWVAPTGRYAFAVVRADLFALGVYDATGAPGSGDDGPGNDASDPERVHFEGFESNVKGDHSKGGFSQDRFERIRDDQIRDHVEKCQDALADVGGLADVRGDDGGAADLDVDRVFVVGQSTLLDEFDADATAAVDATGKPEEALEHAHRAFWTVKLSLL